MTTTGSISVSGLLGGTAGQIDTTSLISQLMTAAAVPQTQLKSQLTSAQTVMTAYQAINSTLTALKTAAGALTDPTAFTATAASSSNTSVVATSDGTASAGSTTFSVSRLARPQVTTIAADSSGAVVGDPSNGITVTGADGTAHAISLASGSAEDVAAAINQAGVGVKASVVQTDSGKVLQLTSSTTGSQAAFTTSGFENPAQNLATAQSAQVTVGDPTAGGYTISSQSNTFTGFIPGVTFTVSALATDVSIGVTSDVQSISDKVAALVAAANAATTQINSDTGVGGVLQGKYDARILASSIVSAVSKGTSDGQSLSKYGIDVDSTGQMSFDAGVFATAYANDPTATASAVSRSFASSLQSTSTAAVDPTTGTITASISSLTTQESTLNDQIDAWTTRLAQTQDSLSAKYNAMETALAKLQSQQTYLTSMFDSITKSSSDSSS